jgi:hypothetical protein
VSAVGRTERTDTAARHPDPGASSRRLLAVMVLVLCLAGLGVVTLGAAADRGPGPVWAGETVTEYGFDPPREAYGEPDWATREEPTRPPDPEGPDTGLIIALAVLGVVLLALVAWVVHGLRRLARPPAELAPPADADELSVAQARSALEEARESLSTVMDAHDAVIAAWLALERAIAEAGVRRDPSRTTLEFVTAVLADLDLDRAALDELAALYRRALFDPEPLREEARDRARTLLDRLTADLRGEGGPSGRGARRDADRRRDEGAR